MVAILPDRISRGISRKVSFAVMGSTERRHTSTRKRESICVCIRRVRVATNLQKGV